MDKFDYDLKTLRRAENVIRVVLNNGAGTDVTTLLPVLGFENEAQALEAAEVYAREALLPLSPTRRESVQRAKKMLEAIPPKALAAFDRKIASQ